MADDLTPAADTTESLSYQVCIQGHLDLEWADWFGGLTLMHVEDDTLLTGPALDQAALFGLLKKVRDAGLSLISVNPVAKTEKE